MKRPVHIMACALATLLAVIAMAQPEPRTTSRTAETLSPVPSLGLVEAVRVAEAHLKEKKISTDQHYLDNVRLQQSSTWVKGRHWIVAWKLNNVMTDGGEIFVLVDMDKNVKVTHGE